MIDEAREAHSFLKTIFGGKPDDAYVVVGVLHPSVSMTSFTDLAKAAAFVAGKPDQYVHVGVTRKAFTGGTRPKVADIVGLGALWADVDVLHPVHKKTALPPTHDAARDLIRAMGLPPGILIDSGHGLQAWWPLREFWLLDEEEEHRRARILARAWGITLRERAKVLGYEVDMVSDLARVLRIPGTLNAKIADAIVPVQVAG